MNLRKTGSLSSWHKNSQFTPAITTCDFGVLICEFTIKNARMDLAPINILIGANGSGKSNFISFFEFINGFCNRKLNEYIALNGGINKVLHNGQINTDTISFKVGFEKGVNSYSAKLKRGSDGFIFLEENLMYRGHSSNINRLGTEAQIKAADSFSANYVIKHLDGFRKYNFQDNSANSPFSKYSNVENDCCYFYEDGMNIAAFMYHIRESDKIVYNRIIKNIQSIAPYFSDFYFLPHMENNFRLQWTDKYSDVVFGANDLSGGTLRFIALSILFLQPNLPDSIIIDGPELGLHPTAIAKLAAMIHSASDRGCQVIIATQSTDLIGHFLPEDIITVDQIRGETIFNRLNSNNLHQWLEDCSIDDLWKRNVIAGGQTN